MDARAGGPEWRRSRVALATCAAGSSVFLWAGCSAADNQANGAVALLAQCLDLAADPRPPPVVCTLDPAGEVIDVSEVPLAVGRPFVVNERLGQVAAVDAMGRLAVISEDSVRVLVENVATAAYVFDGDGELLALRPDGSAWDAEGRLVAEFELEGLVDVTSGVTVSGSAIAFVVEHDGGGFAVMVGDLQTETTRILAESTDFVGQPRWSPDGSRLAFTDYESIRVHDLNADRTTTIAVTSRPSLSGVVTSPAWVDDARLVFVDAAPALVFAEAASGEVHHVTVFNANSDPVPVMPIRLVHR